MGAIQPRSLHARLRRLGWSRPGQARRLVFAAAALACCWHRLGSSAFMPSPCTLLSRKTELGCQLGLGAAASTLSLAGCAPAAHAAAGVAESTLNTQDALIQAFVLTFVSEIGDKTFFIAAILAAGSGGSSASNGLGQKVLTFIGAIAALAVMTFIAVALGQVFHSVPDVAGGLPLDDYASILAFGYFGVKLLIDASKMSDEDSMLDEREEAEEAVKESGLPSWVTSLSIPPVVIQAFTLVFAAEIGDRSFISAAALSAQGGTTSAAAVFLGGISAHGIATLLAVVLGELISTYVSEKTLTYVGGSLFLVFAATSTANVLGLASS